jgi:hypothetical protein
VISQAEFAFTIGYDGPQAVVDARALKGHSGASPIQLLEEGQFRAAYAAALYSGDQAAIKAVMDGYNAKAGTAFSSQEEFSRLFGVYIQEIQKVKRL